MEKNIDNRNKKDINKYKYYKKQNELIEKNNEEGIISNNNKFINKNNTYNVYKENNLKSNAGITIITKGTTSALPKKSQAILTPSPISPISAKVFATFETAFWGAPLNFGQLYKDVVFCTFIVWQYSKTCKK